MDGYTRRPEWLKLRPLDSTILNETRKLMRDLKLHTVCESAQCPNRTECFAAGTATFMILGEICTRNCTFCAVKHGTPQAPDAQEPKYIVEAVKKLGLQYVVITSVTRDDLSDGGASQFAQTIASLHEYRPGVEVEVLIPDFGGSFPALQTVIDAHPTILNHNVETVPRLYPEVRPHAEYQRSLEVLRQSKLIDKRVITKSGFMLGLGESRYEITEVMADLRQAGCDVLTIGQYLPPSLRHHGLAKYIPPEEFKEYANMGKQLGFRHVTSGPLIRSSFHAAETFRSTVADVTCFV